MTDVGRFDAAIRHPDGPRDKEVAEVAGRQHGVIAHRQLIAIGVRAGAAHRKVLAGRLHRVHVGVYAVGHRRLSQEGRWMAAVLACGATALLSHRAAARLWGLLDTSTHPPDVTTGRSPDGQQGIALHRSRRIHAEDRAVRGGVPVTSVARTLLDLAEVVPRRRLDRALEQSERLGLFDLRTVERLIRRSRGRHGLRPLRGALADYRPPAFTRSELERRFLELCRDANLPRPSSNLFLAGMEVDVAWPDHRLVVELDGHETHRTRAAFERDRRRDTTLQLAGYRVLRVTYGRLQSEPAEVMAAVRSLLDRV